MIFKRERYKEEIYVNPSKRQRTEDEHGERHRERPAVSEDRARCFAWKAHGGMYGTAGIPDIIACIGGRFIITEVKASGKLAKLQEITLQRISEAEGCAFKVTSVGRSGDT